VWYLAARSVGDAPLAPGEWVVQLDPAVVQRAGRGDGGGPFLLRWPQGPHGDRYCFTRAGAGGDAAPPLAGQVAVHPTLVLAPNRARWAAGAAHKAFEDAEMAPVHAAAAPAAAVPRSGACVAERPVAMQTLPQHRDPAHASSVQACELTELRQRQRALDAAEETGDDDCTARAAVDEAQAYGQIDVAFKTPRVEEGGVRHGHTSRCPGKSSTAENDKKYQRACRRGRTDVTQHEAGYVEAACRLDSGLLCTLAAVVPLGADGGAVCADGTTGVVHPQRDAYNRGGGNLVHEAFPGNTNYSSLVRVDGAVHPSMVCAGHVWDATNARVILEPDDVAALEVPVPEAMRQGWWI
jgi:hypothetical protein